MCPFPPPLRVARPEWFFALKSSKGWCGLVPAPSGQLAITCANSAVQYDDQFTLVNATAEPARPAGGPRAGGPAAGAGASCGLLQQGGPCGDQAQERPASTGYGGTTTTTTTDATIISGRPLLLVSRSGGLCATPPLPPPQMPPPMLPPLPPPEPAAARNAEASSSPRSEEACSDPRASPAAMALGGLAALFQGRVREALRAWRCALVCAWAAGPLGAPSAAEAAEGAAAPRRCCSGSSGAEDSGAAAPNALPPPAADAAASSSGGDTGQSEQAAAAFLGDLLPRAVECSPDAGPPTLEQSFELVKSDLKASGAEGWGGVGMRCKGGARGACVDAQEVPIGGGKLHAVDANGLYHVM